MLHLPVRLLPKKLLKSPSLVTPNLDLSIAPKRAIFPPSIPSLRGEIGYFRTFLYLLRTTSTSQKARGYTLLEMLVVIGIVAILIAIAAPSLLAMQGVAKLNTSSDKVRSALELSQTAAIQKNQSCTVYIPSGSNIVSTCLIAADYTSSGISGVPNGLPMVKLDDGITVRTVSMSGTPPGVIYNLKGITQNSGTIILESSDTSSKKCLTINAGIGLIRNGLYVGSTCEISE
jgi:prepilin-type N-terminal cleavage/methylation domain-containing protein